MAFEGTDGVYHTAYFNNKIVANQIASWLLSGREVRQNMHEARIEVKQTKKTFTVRLIDVTGGGKVLATGKTGGEALTQGFPNLLYLGKPLTADALQTAGPALTK